MTDMRFRLPGIRRLAAPLVLIALIMLFALLGRRTHDDWADPGPDVVLKRNLKALAQRQEVHYATAGTYAHPDSLADFSLAPGAELVQATFSEDDWTAVLRHAESGLRCGTVPASSELWCSGF